MIGAVIGHGHAFAPRSAAQRVGQAAPDRVVGQTHVAGLGLAYQLLEDGEQAVPVAIIVRRIGRLRYVHVVEQRTDPDIAEGRQRAQLGRDLGPVRHRPQHEVRIVTKPGDRDGYLHASVRQPAQEPPEVGAVWRSGFGEAGHGAQAQAHVAHSQAPAAGRQRGGVIGRGV